MIPEIYHPDSQRYDNGMTYRRCGYSGVLLPEISLGLWHNFGAVDPLSRSLSMIHYAFDHGITHFDLANNYGPPYGTAEETWGEVMRRSLAPYRHELFISSKAGYDMWPGPYGNWGSRKYLMTSLEQSLRRMRLDYVDLFYTHRFDPNTPIEETLQALVDMVRQGKALYVGISRWPLEATSRAFDYLAERDVPCLVFQDKYNILDREPQQSGKLDLLKQRKVGFVSFSPLAQGVLTDRYLHGIPQDSRVARGGHLKSDSITPELIEKVRKLNDMALRRGETLAEMALTWVLSDERVTSVIVGASSVEQLQKNLHTLSAPRLTPEEKLEIDRIIL